MKVEQSVLAAISGADYAGNTMKLVNQLERSLYAKVARVIELAGGKWNRGAQCHLFATGTAEEAMDPILLTGEVVDRAKEFGEFFTPAAVAERVIEKAHIAAGSRVLEPSAGQGDLALRAQAAGAYVDCVEIQGRNADHLRALGFGSVEECDFLQLAAVRHYHRVVMNPPFAARADVRHVFHALNFLKPGGRLVAIMSAGVTFREDHLYRSFRAQIESLESLPAGSFKDAGTNINAVIVTVQL